MTTIQNASLALFLPSFTLASCAVADSGESSVSTAAVAAKDVEYSTTEIAEFERPWAIEFAPGTKTLFVSEKAGTLKLMNTQTSAVSEVGGAPDVDFGGQGGLGDIAFLASEADKPLDGRTIYLSWAEAGEDDTRGAAAGRGKLSCDEAGEDCAITDMKVIWRQSLKTSRRGHYSHRITFSPDEKYLYIASGDRQELTPAQDNTNNLGTIVRLMPDGSIPPDNPIKTRLRTSAEIWSYGHRNILGMDWDAHGRLWEVEHGPAGGDELNLVERAANYGWPTRSFGKHYNGDPITDHSEDDGFAKPAMHWTPVIAPGDMIIYSGEMFDGWANHAVIAGLQSQGLVLVKLDGESASEALRIDLESRIRSVEQGPDGSIWVAQDGRQGKVIKLTAK